MQTCKVNKWYPLASPNVTFIDKHGEPNAFLECNASLFLQEGECFILLVRLINYRKFSDRSYKVAKDFSESRYLICRGVGDSFDTEIFEELKFEALIPLYEAYWRGYEDIRFIDEKRLLVTIPQASPTGKPIVCLASLNGRIVTVSSVLNPHVQEKNWMPFSFMGADLVVYSVSPLAIKSLANDDIF